MNPLISIVILTHHRPTRLARALESVRSEFGSEFECIVVINGRDDLRSRELVEQQGGAFRTFTVDQQHPGGARNTGISQARGKWILFLDDDAYLPRGWSPSVRLVVARNFEAAVIGGPNLTPPSSSAFAESLGRVLSSRLGAYHSARRYQEKIGHGPCHDESVMLCNLLVRREVLLRTGIRFDPTLSCNEENLLIQQIEAQGEKVFFDSEFYVFHERRQSAWSLARQVFKYGQGRARNTMRRPSSVHWAHLVPAGGIVYLLLATGIYFYGAIVLYGLTLLLGAWNLRDWRAFSIFPVIHFSYGLGFWAGWVPNGLRVAVRSPSHSS